MKNVLIIGGAGFIGTELTKRHLTAGDQVTILDDCSNCLSYVFKINHPRLRIIRGGVENINLVFRKLLIENKNILYRDFQFDIVYHLASESRPTEFNRQLRKIIESNVRGLLELLAFIQEYNSTVKTKIIYASTSEVYGSSKDAFKETDNSVLDPTASRHCYAYSKLLSESILQNSLEFNWNIVRFFNAYGPNNREDDTKFVPMLIKAHRDKKVFNIYGDGERTRTFTYVTDVVDALVRIARSKYQHEVWNIAGNETYTLREVVDMFKREGFEFKVEHEDKRPGEAAFRKASDEKIKTLLGWSQQVKLIDGIRKIKETL